MASFHSHAHQTNAIADQLAAATGLDWNPPPEHSTYLQNGYHVQMAFMQAPHVVKKLQDIAITATGRPRAILFERCDKCNAMVKIPKELAENEAFLLALSRASSHGRLQAS